MSPSAGEPSQRPAPRSRREAGEVERRRPGVQHRRSAAAHRREAALNRGRDGIGIAHELAVRAGRRGELREGLQSVTA